jgi:hypothetical protein
MAEPSTDRVPRHHTRPRWVKVAMIIGAVLLLLAVLSLLGVLPRGPGGHGPGRHISLGDPSTVGRFEAGNGVLIGAA